MVTFKKIKTTTPKIRDQLIRLQKACLPDDEPADPNEGQWWLGYSGGQPIAFCQLKASTRWLDTAYLARSGVLYLWRGKGLQKRMIRIREREARRLNYTWMVSDTTENPPSANSLARTGYQMFDPATPWGNETSLYWRKRLR
jgi:GNAT superfamily N-acetyltransferase